MDYDDQRIVLIREPDQGNISLNEVISLISFCRSLFLEKLCDRVKQIVFIRSSCVYVVAKILMKRGKNNLRLIYYKRRQNDSE